MKFHDGQYQFKFRFMLYADIESILKPVDEQYNEKMNQIKTEREGKTPYTKKINTHVPSGCVYTRHLLMEIPLIYQRYTVVKIG